MGACDSFSSQGTCSSALDCSWQGGSCESASRTPAPARGCHEHETKEDCRNQREWCVYDEEKKTCNDKEDVSCNDMGHDSCDTDVAHDNGCKWSGDGCRVSGAADGDESDDAPTAANSSDDESSTWW